MKMLRRLCVTFVLAGGLIGCTTTTTTNSNLRNANTNTGYVVNSNGSAPIATSTPMMNGSPMSGSGDRMNGNMATNMNQNSNTNSNRQP